MSSHSRVQDLAKYLILRACRRLPYDIRNERYREWTAELPAILDDPGIRFPGRRVARALLYAADHYRGARKLPQTSSPNTTIQANGGLVAFTGRADFPTVRALIADRAKQAGVPASSAIDLVISVSEIIANTLMYTSSGGLVRVWQAEDEILCQIDDTGYITDPSAWRERLAPEGCHGLWLVRQICDQVDIWTSKAGTTVRLHMRLPGAGGVGADAVPSQQGSEGRPQ